MNTVRSVLAAVALLSVVWLQPTASAEGCKIDLSDPTQPQIYGDCVGLTHSVQQSEHSFSAEAGVSTDIGISDPTGVLCSSHTCRIGIDQQVRVGFDPEEPASSPGLFVGTGARLNETEESPCLVEPKESVANVTLVGCVPSP